MELKIKETEKKGILQYIMEILRAKYNGKHIN